MIMKKITHGMKKITHNTVIVMNGVKKTMIAANMKTNVLLHMIILMKKITHNNVIVMTYVMR